MVYESCHIQETRKNHNCEYCGKIIPAGSPAFYEHGIFDHEPFGRYCCEICEPFIDDFWNYMDGEAGGLCSDFHYWVQYSHIPHPLLTVEIECPSCGTVRVMRDHWEDDGFADCPKCGVTLEEGDGV